MGKIIGEDYLIRICNLTFVAALLIVTVLFIKLNFTWGQDIYAHLTYAKIFDRALREGQFPVRYVESIQNGFSQPLFNYYQVGFYYLVSLFNLVFNSITLSIKVAVMFLWLLSAFFVYLLAAKFGKFEALFASLVYAFSPYLIADIIFRASYPEFAAISFVPAILYFLDKTLSKSSLLDAALLSVFIALMLISHLPAFVIFSPVIFSYFYYLVIKNRPDFRGVILSVTAGILGFGLGSFYVIPAILELNLVKSSLLKSSGFDFNNNFLSFSELSQLVFQYTGFINTHVILAFATSTTGLIFIPRRRILDSNLLFWAGVIAFSLFMMTRHSIEVWKALSFIAFIQFPWRFLMITPIAMALISALLLRITNRVYLKALIILITLAFSIFVCDRILISREFIDVSYFNQSINELQNNKEALKQAYKEPGYNPKGADLAPLENTLAWVSTGGAKITELSLKDGYKSFRVAADDLTTLQLNSRFFPGWNGYIDQKKVALNAVPGYNYMSLEIPKGEHIVEFKMEDTLIRRIANLVTSASAGTLFLIISWDLLKRKELFSPFFGKFFNRIP